MMNRAVRLAARDLRRRLSPARVDGALGQLHPVPAAPARAGNGGEVCVCALQMEAAMYADLSAWLRVLDAALAKAAARGAQLVCLPELYGMIPFFLSPVLRLAARAAGRLTGADRGASDGAPAALYGLLSPFDFVQPAYESILSRFAARYGIWLSGGTSLVPEGGRVYNHHVLFSPAGAVLARQDKIHLTMEERQLGVSAGDALTIVETPIGRIALSVCMDATYFETFRVARRMGADYMIVPIGDMAEFSPWLAQRGAQSRVSETGLAAVKAALVSAPGFPLLFTGRAGVYFPAGCGYENVETAGAKGQGMALARFRLTNLRAAPADPFGRRNAAFDRRYFEELAAAPARRGWTGRAAFQDKE